MVQSREDTTSNVNVEYAVDDGVEAAGSKEGENRAKNGTSSRPAETRHKPDDERGEDSKKHKGTKGIKRRRAGASLVAEDTEKEEEQTETIKRNKAAETAKMYFNEDAAPFGGPLPPPSSAASSQQQLLQQQQFLHDNHKIDIPTAPRPINEAYGTTLLLLVTIHVIFFRQWNSRRIRRSDVVATYRQVVRRKQFHRVIGAIMSFPAHDYASIDIPPGLSATTTTAAATTSRSISMGSDDYSTSQDMRQGVIPMNTSNMLSRIVHHVRYVIWPMLLPYLQPLISGHLSGLPCLFYTSHILWQCRALEELYDESLNGSSFGYLRALIGLTLISLLLKYASIHRLLTITRDGSSTSVIHRRLMDRGVCTLTSTASAVMVVFSRHFANVPLDLLPLIRGSSDPILSQWICTALLMLVSARLHPITGVIYGMLSGILWSMGITSWLGAPYWGGCMITSLILACLLSFRAEWGARDNVASQLLAFIDYVSWDDSGVVHSYFHPTTSASSAVPSARRRGTYAAHSTSNGITSSFEGEPLLQSELQGDSAGGGITTAVGNSADIASHLRGRRGAASNNGAYHTIPFDSMDGLYD